MSQLRNNPIGEVPKRVFINSLVITVLLIGATFIFNWPTIPVVIGFWMGAGINLINFRIIVIGTKNFLERSEEGKKASMAPNIMLRYFLYGLVFVGAWRIGISALMASLLGACMVNFAFKTDGFFTMGMDRTADSDLKKRANIERVDAGEENRADRDELETIENNKTLESDKEKNRVDRDETEITKSNEAIDLEEEEIEVYL